MLSAARDLQRQQLAQQNAEREQCRERLLLTDAIGVRSQRDREQQRAAGQRDRTTEQSDWSDAAHGRLLAVQAPKNL